MAEGTTAIDLALTTEGDADGTDLIEFADGTFEHAAGPPEGPLQYTSDHEEQGIRRLAPPFWGKPFVAGLLQSFLAEIQSLEDTLWEMLELRTIAGADLTRLKVLGKIVGQPRLGFGTEDYRLLIEARALANVSRGRGSDLLRILDVLVGQGQYVLVTPGNATLYVTALDELDDSDIAVISAVLPDARAAGVGLQFLYSDDDDVFIWGDAWGAPEVWGTVRLM